MILPSLRCKALLHGCVSHPSAHFPAMVRKSSLAALWNQPPKEKAPGQMWPCCPGCEYKTSETGPRYGNGQLQPTHCRTNSRVFTLVGFFLISCVQPLLAALWFPSDSSHSDSSTDRNNMQQLCGHPAGLVLVDYSRRLPIHCSKPA